MIRSGLVLALTMTAVIGGQAKAQYLLSTSQGVFGGVGTAVGGYYGGVAGAIAGGTVGQNVGQYVYNNRYGIANAVSGLGGPFQYQTTPRYIPQPGVTYSAPAYGYSIPRSFAPSVGFGRR